MAPPSIPGPKPTFDLFDDVVNVIVGSGSATKVFTVHKGALCHYSGYFDKALNGAFKEARKKEVILAEEDVEVFQDFVVWLYTGTVPEHWHNLCQLWIFADRRDLPLLMNVSLDGLRNKIVSTWKVPTKELRLIYSETTEASALRRFLLHVISRTGGVHLLKDDEAMKQWPKAALSDVLMAVWNVKDWEKWSKKQVANMNMCQYHRHEKGMSCDKVVAKT